MNMNLIVYFLLYLTRISAQPVISTAQGRIRGISRDGYTSYLGIPYASITTPGGRFKASIDCLLQRAGLAPTWANIREPKEPLCYPSSPVEECLQLDVHAPSGSGLPVLVWVTGGSGRYDPSLLVKQEIIVVVVRHRIGPIGFLCSSEDKIPGNAGLKDVVLSLQWVRDNIVAFHGNPNKVVVAGQSFGAAMVESLMLTSMAQGLFHGVILQSGTVLAPWAFNFDAEDRAKFLRMELNGSKEMMTLSKTAIANLVSKAEGLELPYLPFAICIDNISKNEERLLSQSPFDLLSSGRTTKMPMIIGYNNNEAYIFASMLKDAKVVRRMSQNMDIILPIELQANKRGMPHLMKNIKEMYFEENITMAAMLAYHRDAYFLGHIHRSARLHASLDKPVYYYQFSYMGNVGVEDEPGMAKTGAAHSDELGYLFPEKGRKLQGDDGIVQDHLIRLWTKFVKHLNPTARDEHSPWEPINSHDARLLNINMDLDMIEFPYKREAQMWEDVYEKYYFERNRYNVP